MPSGAQRREMRRFAGACRFVYNKALALQKQRDEQGEKKLGYAGLCRALTQWRNGEETPWLKNAPVHPLQQSLKDLERAYGNFFARRADVPTCRAAGRRAVTSAVGIRIRSRSSAIRPRAASSCRNLAGCATAAAARCWER